MALGEVLNKIKYGDIALPRIARIPDDHVLVPGYQTAPFEAGRDYFTVRANSVSLRHDRSWFSTWQPMLVAVTEFRYGTSEVSVPFVIGPDGLRQRAQAEIPLATVFTATQLVGIHPYVGDRVAVTVLLFRIKKDDYVQRLLGVVEKMAAAFDYSTMLAPYLKLTGAVIDGIDGLLGRQDPKTPVLGYRTEYNPNAGDVFRPGCYAVTTGPLPAAAELWVHEDHLLRAGPGAGAAPVREDLIVYSITGTPARNDYESLPWFAPLWQRVDAAASTPTNQGKEAMKAHLRILREQLRFSPDITKSQAKDIYAEHEALAMDLHADALRLLSYGKQAAPDSGADAGDELRRESLAVLNEGW